MPGQMDLTDEEEEAMKGMPPQVALGFLAARMTVENLPEE